jgi:hypothetical protein
MLSQWETLAYDQDGHPLPEGLTSPEEIRVQIRRNWLYVDDPTAWVPGGGFAFPTVLTVQSGDLRYRDVHIQATRGPQDGIYVVAHSARYPDPTSGVSAEGRWMFGCGVYGWAVESPAEDHVCRTCEHRRRSVPGWDPRDCPHNGRSVHVGLSPRSRSFLQGFVRGTDFPEAGDLMDLTDDADPADPADLVDLKAPEGIDAHRIG